MIATTRTEVVVTLELSQREALLLRALLNGMDVTPNGAESEWTGIASSLRPGGGVLTPAEIVELNDVCCSLHSALGEVSR